MLSFLVLTLFSVNLSSAGTHGPDGGVPDGARKRAYEEYNQAYKLSSSWDHSAVSAILASVAYETGTSPEEVRQAYVRMNAVSSVWDTSPGIAELTRAQILTGKSPQEVYD